MTEASETESKAGVWVPGMKSPNPAGRPPGPSKQQKLLRRMLDEANDVLDAVLAKAKDGDPASAGLIFGRILPVLRAQSQTVQFDFDPSLPVARQVEQVLAAIASGQIAPDLGQQIVSAIGTLSNIRATEELSERLAILEAKAVNT
jgi:hypothetical protein